MESSGLRVVVRSVMECEYHDFSVIKAETGSVLVQEYNVKF